MDEAVIPLRAHHGLCLRFFQGKGYSGAFVENMAQKKAMLEENPLVRLTDQADEICRACPNNLSGQCESAEKVRRYDREVLSRCGLTVGDVLPYRELTERVRKTILLPGHREEICGDCQWTDLCQCLPCWKTARGRFSPGRRLPGRFRSPGRPCGRR